MPVVAMVVGLLQRVKVCEREGIATEDYDGFIRQMVPLVLEDTLRKVRQEGFADDPARAESSIELMAPSLRSSRTTPGTYKSSLFDALGKLFQTGVAAGYGAKTGSTLPSFWSPNSVHPT